jgi:hypothetical protein
MTVIPSLMPSSLVRKPLSWTECAGHPGTETSRSNRDPKRAGFRLSAPARLAQAVPTSRRTRYHRPLPLRARYLADPAAPDCQGHWPHRRAVPQAPVITAPEERAHASNYSRCVPDAPEERGTDQTLGGETGDHNDRSVLGTAPPRADRVSAGSASIGRRISSFT